MNRRIAVITASAVAAVTAGLAWAGEAGASHTSKQETAQARSSITSDYEVTSYGLVINIKNNSSHAMTYLTPDGKDPKNTPKAVLSPGGTDRLAYKADSTGMFVRLNYRVGNTQELVSPAFSVPPAGPNNFACSANDRSAKSPVGSTCDIGKGWEPDAHLTFVNR